MWDMRFPPPAGGGGGDETLPMNEMAETSSLKFAGARMTMLYSGRGGGGATPGWAELAAGRAPSALAVTSPEGETSASCRLPPRPWLALESRDDRDCPHGNSSGSGLAASGSAVGVRIPAWHDAERCCCFDPRLDRDGRADFRRDEEDDDECEDPTLSRLTSKRCC